ncbi:MAG TPA: PAS domain-containing protein, partial [Fimbriiglobus sp.]|nr:PAS domain-containing protein [Fimbriiglobus sp.]
MGHSSFPTDAAFRVLIEHAADLIVVVDAAGAVCYVSPSAARLGYAADGWVGQPYEEIAHPEDRAALCGALAGAVECRLPLTDGSWRAVEAVATDLRSDPAVGGVMI